MQRRPDQSFTNPLGGVILGDPFVLWHRGRFYLYGTNDGPPLSDGRAIPVFRSDDLLQWELLGGALEPLEPQAEHWAPEVLAWNGRFYMVVSFGDVDRRGHALWVAVADQPEGPFQAVVRLSDPSEAFSIDGAWLLDDDGRLYLFGCLDFVDPGDLPYGTGIVVQPMHDPLNRAAGPVPVLRAHAPWHLFLANRTMPLYGGRTFPEWTTIEGPAPVRRAGRVFCGYSGGNYLGAYGTGEVVADTPLGPYTDLRGQEGPLFATVPGVVDGPGHFSVVRPDLVHDWIVLHGRRPGEAVRRVWLCPAAWDRDGVQVGRLTDQPQPAPPLPADLSRFAGLRGREPGGWEVEAGVWDCDGDGFRQGDPAATEAVAWRQAVALPDDWTAEVYVRFPEPAQGVAGLAIHSPAAELRVMIEPAAARVHAIGAGGERVEADLPTLGAEPFNPAVFHAIEVRARAGTAEVRIDGVVRFSGLTVPPAPRTLGLRSTGRAVFDAIAIAAGSSGRKS